MARYVNAAGSYASHSKEPLAAFNKLCILSPFFGGSLANYDAPKLKITDKRERGRGERSFIAISAASCRIWNWFQRGSWQVTKQ